MAKRAKTPTFVPKSAIEARLFFMKKNLRILLFAMTAMLTGVVIPSRMAAQVERADTLSRQPALSTQNPEVQSRMMTSPLPVSIRQQGRQICVQSRYNQILPIYTEGGVFYTAFRLSKGTNWLSGLPKGTYYINNRKFTIY
ncbi:MAG: hypothetical protein IJQ59_01700 [Bacteroidaceae bacterium]|nr:hypothetical protein [Bacteroidaceae bacterium]